MKPLFVNLFSVLVTLFSGSLSAQQTLPSQRPVAGKDWELPLAQKITLSMSWIPAGTFIMGSPETEAGRKPDESPQTTVTLTDGYWIGTTEVTIGEWKAITGMNVRDKVIKLLNDTTPYDFMGKKMLIRDFMHFDKNNPDIVLANENDELPMYFVNWNEAMEFCRKLTSHERAAHRLPKGYEYTLPTEAQWEYACRAGSTGPIFGAATDDIAWFGGNSFKGYNGKGFGNPATGSRNVATKQPNKWGLYDMLGNLWEWCYDWYGPYTGGRVINPIGPATGIYRVNRGGSFGSGINDERSANRATNPPNEDSAWRGFRVVLTRLRKS